MHAPALTLTLTLALTLALASAHAAPPRRLPLAKPDAAARARYEAAADYSEARGGVALLVVHGDAVAFSRAPAGSAVTEAHPVYSGAKGFLCPLVMAGVEDGRFALDDAAGPVLVLEGAAPQPVRVRDLLTMTSGLDEARWWLEVDGATGPARRKIPDDRYAYARALDVVLAPGRVFQYSGVHASALGGFLVAQRIDPHRTLTERVLKPLGVKPRRWASDKAGQPILTHGMSLAAEHFARLGMLMRDDGAFLGQRLFAPGRLAACLTGSDALPAYGLGWWLNAPLSLEAAAPIPLLIREHLATSPAGVTRPFAPGPPDLFAAIGSHDQRMYVVPSRGLVIVRLARENPADLFVDADFLALLLR